MINFNHNNINYNVENIFDQYARLESNQIIFNMLIDMIFLGIPQNIYHFMEVLHTMTIIIMLVEEVKAILPQYLPIVITFMEPIR